MQKRIFISIIVAFVYINTLFAQEYITGGHQINITAAPWQVLLKINDNYGCGGSIIASDVILTAKHCVENLGSEQVKVIAGVTCKSEVNINNTFDVKRIILHPTLDAALLILRTEIPTTNKSKAINFKSATNNQYYNEGNLVSVSGWGY